MPKTKAAPSAAASIMAGPREKLSETARSLLTEHIQARADRPVRAAGDRYSAHLSTRPPNAPSRPNQSEEEQSIVGPSDPIAATQDRCLPSVLILGSRR